MEGLLHSQSIKGDTCPYFYFYFCYIPLILHGIPTLTLFIGLVFQVPTTNIGPGGLRLEGKQVSGPLLAYYFLSREAQKLLFLISSSPINQDFVEHGTVLWGWWTQSSLGRTGPGKKNLCGKKRHKTPAPESWTGKVERSFKSFVIGKTEVSSKNH